MRRKKGIELGGDIATNSALRVEISRDTNAAQPQPQLPRRLTFKASVGPIEQKKSDHLHGKFAYFNSKRSALVYTVSL